jgi:hypothetical protein
MVGVGRLHDYFVHFDVLLGFHRGLRDLVESGRTFLNKSKTINELELKKVCGQIITTEYKDKQSSHVSFSG